MSALPVYPEENVFCLVFVD